MHTYSTPCVQNNFFPSFDSASRAVAMNFLAIFCNPVTHFPLWFGSSCEQVYGGHEFIPDLDLDLTNQVSPFRLCFGLCSQAIGNWSSRASVSTAMRACWPVWAWHNGTFFSGKGGLTVSGCGTKAEGHFTVNSTLPDVQNYSPRGIVAAHINSVDGIV